MNHGTLWRRAAALTLYIVPLLWLRPFSAQAYIVQYKEQYYELYHIHYNQYPDDTIENIYWLEKAIKADFANPLYALALIETEKEWERYRYLFMMHLHLKLIEQYLRLGEKWNKRHAYFYNAPWKDQNLESLEIAESCFLAALSYWEDAKAWADKANDREFYFMNIKRIQNWEDEAARISDGELNYEKMINRELMSLQKVRETFLAMDENIY